MPRARRFDAVYLDEVEAICRSSDELGDLPAWDAFVNWAGWLVAYVSTKRALAEALNHNSEMFQAGRAAVQETGRTVPKPAPWRPASPDQG